MYNDKNEIIYIGKAKNLKNRVSQYFLNTQEGKTKAMVSNVNHFETIITSNEKEALILEMNLIQKHHPRYNILLIDDKHYPYIELHNKIEHPYISIARRLKNKKSIYFGPYPNSTFAFEMVDIINDLFPLRKCINIPKSPCLYYHMHKCLGPCINKINKDEYSNILDNINHLLKGDNKELIDKLKEKMIESSEKENYENALFYKKKIDSIQYINQKQVSEFNDNKTRNYIGFFTQGNYISIDILIYNKGIFIGKKEFTYQLIGDLNEFITSILYQYYSSIPLPDLIILNNEKIKDELSKNIDCQFEIAKCGKNLDIINNSIVNSKETLNNFIHYRGLKKDKEELLNELGNLLNISIPYRIELFDNSHLQGSNAIGAMVTYINGEEYKKDNRLFNINSFNKKDDLSSMKEVLERRYSRLKKENGTLPNLIILDGGKTQIEVGNKVLKSLELNIPLCGLVKNDKHQTRGLINNNYQEILINDNELLLFLTKMQDSIHKFAISSHVRKRNKSMFNSIFNEIKGIGEKRKELLLSHYSSIDELYNADIIELSQILPKEVATNLYRRLHNEK